MITSDGQNAYFKDSKVRMEDGTLKPVYHGTGAIITAFDPSYTGQGNDQYGSGFYFSSNRDTAVGYTTSRLTGDDGQPLEKPGGEENPNVLEVFLNITNPILVDGKAHANLRHIQVGAEDSFRILKHHPGLYLDMDSEECNPLGDYFPEYWDNPPKTKAQFERYIRRLAFEYFDDANLLHLDVFFKDYPTEFRKALREVFGYDGVIVDFGTSQHYIAWFPEQIKLVTNLEPTDCVEVAG